VNPMTGTENWRFEVPQLSSLEPSFFRGSVAVVSEYREIYSISSEGTLDWRMDLLYTIDRAPSLNDAFLVAMTQQGRMNCYNLSAGVIVSGTMIAPPQWSSELQCREFLLATNRTSWGWSGSYNHDFVLCTRDDRLTALYAENGTEYWSRQFGNDISHDLRILYLDCDETRQHVVSLYVVLENNAIYKLYDNGTEAWSYQSNEHIVLPPRLSVEVVIGWFGFKSNIVHLFVATQTGVVVLDDVSGTTLEYLELTGEPLAITLSERQVIVSTGTEVASYRNRFASPADTGESSPLPGSAALIALCAAVLFRRKRRSS